MTIAAFDRLGQIKGTGDERALFLKLGIAEVLAAFDRNCVFKGKVRERNISGGKSASFPVTGRAKARYHVPGTQALGQGNTPGDRNEETINLDGLMIADDVIYDLDELMNYYDVRQDKTHQLGQALAVEWDERIARILYAAAKRTTSPLGKTINANRVGNTKTLSGAYATASKSAKGEELASAIGDIKVAMKKKDVPTNDLVCIIPPDEYDFLNESPKLVNKDYTANANGGVDTGALYRVKGIPVFESNAVTQAAYTLQDGDKNPDYAQNLSKCRALIFHRSAVGVLTLRRPDLQVTSKGGDFNIMYQSTLMVARMAIGMGVLRGECAGVIEVP